jgi:hypothetical protein
MKAEQSQHKLDMILIALEKIASQPVAPILPIAPVAPVAPVLPLIQPNSGDHDIITGLVKDVANIDKKVDALSLKLDTRYTTVEEHKVVIGIQDDHETRIRSLETFRDNLMGKIIALGSLSGFVTGIIIVIISHFWK